MAPTKGGYRQINKALNICVFQDYLEGQQAFLPEIKDVVNVTPRVIRVLGQNPGEFTLQGTNTWIVGSGSHRLLIDTGQGFPEWASLISDVLAEENISLSHVLLTHWHGDHTGGVPDLIRMYPHLEKSIYKHSPTKNQQAISDGQIFAVEGATVRAVHTPGHSHDHMCFILEEEGAMFTGDNILGHGSSAVEDLRTWMDTLSIMKSHQCIVGYPAHGIDVADLKAKLESEITSRVRREKQVMEALRQKKLADKATRGRAKGSTTVADVVTLVYGKNVETSVRELALEPFTEEVLRKLAEDGRVAFECRAGTKKWFTIEMS